MDSSTADRAPARLSHLPPIQTVNIIGLPVAATHYAGAIDWIKAAALKADRAYAFEASNTHVAALARHDPSFGAAMAQFDFIAPDGMPLVWSVNRQLEEKEKLTDRVYGPTLMLKTIEATQGETDLKHFLFGGQQSTLDKLQDRFSADYPETTIAGSYSPPFGDWPDDE
ncbi:MAG: WecB/TagA/CpsF family glycosyltransferase, partial [Verrucomicrobiae bacterium]|nr:WecB/TagA/CpsF family glycosyltransferase [Verrucomicrobiae bacterium]NNJ41836.1 hypothetical protein [Akkermansiaceae bacterium]